MRHKERKRGPSGRELSLRGVPAGPPAALGSPPPLFFCHGIRALRPPSPSSVLRAPCAVCRL
eukprot:scaffold605_cov36-Tisochrysis_lutea.AAC.2